MRKPILIWAAAAVLGAGGSLPRSALAQPEAAVSLQREAERQAEGAARRRETQERRETRLAQVQAERRAAADSRDDLESELAEAREQMQDAAREVARLSAEFAAPFVGDMSRRWRNAGERAMLGFNPEDTELGVRVAGVTPNGAAAAAGLAIGDVITQIEGAQLAAPRGAEGANRSPSELLLAQMQNVDPGENVELKVLRDGRERDVTVQTRERDSFAFDLAFGNAPFAGAAAAAQRWPGMFFNSSPWQAVQMVALTPQLGAYFGADKGILVVRGPGSDGLQLQDGDVILDIGGREPTTPEHAVRILASFDEGEMLRINIMRKQRREALEFVVPAAAGRD